MTFHVIMQILNTIAQAIVSTDAYLTRTAWTFQWSLERELVYFTGKLVYLTALASVQLAVTTNIT